MRVLLYPLLVLLAACSRPEPTGPGIRDAGSLFDGVAIPTVPGDPPADGVGPARIVSVIPSMTECVYALGLGGRLVGRDRWSDAPAEAATLPSVGDQRTMSVEKIADLRPDLVVTWKSMPDLSTALVRDFGIRIVEPETETGGAFAGILDLAEACAIGDRGRKLLAVLDDDRRRIEAKFHDKPKRALLVVLDRGQTGIFVVAPGSFLDALFVTSGLVNAAPAGAGPWASLSAEKLAETRPDAILDLSIGDTQGGRAEAEAFWGRFPHLPAVASGRVVVARAPVLVRPGPRFHRAAEVLGDLIHGL